jgi:TM2 domain-containing membrane protein YozV
MVYCPHCGAQVDPMAEICPKCGVRIKQPPPLVESKSPILAAVLSVVFPGLGQIYNGQIGKGIAFLILGAVLVFSIAALIGFVLYPIFWIYNIYDAYTVARKINAGIVKPG